MSASPYRLRTNFGPIGKVYTDEAILGLMIGDLKNENLGRTYEYLKTKTSRIRFMSDVYKGIDSDSMKQIIETAPDDGTKQTLETLRANILSRNVVWPYPGDATTLLIKNSSGSFVNPFRSWFAYTRYRYMQHYFSSMLFTPQK